MIDVINRLVAPLRTRISNLVSRAVVKLVDDGATLQLLQLSILDGETRGDIERIQQFGLSSVPLEGAEAVVLFVGGRRDHGLVVAVDDRTHRPTGLEPGEVALYSATGTKVLLKANGDVEISPASGTVKVTGDLVATGDVVAGTVSLQGHQHPAGAEIAGPFPVSGVSGAPVP